MHTDSVQAQRVAARPGAVTVLAGLVLGGAAFLLVGGVLVAMDMAPMALGAPLLNGLELRGPLAFLFAAAVMAATGLAMLRLQRWSRRAAIVLFAWVLAAAIPGVSSAVITVRPWTIAREGVIVIGCVIAIRYLIDASVRSAFDSALSDLRTEVVPRRSSK